MKWREKILLGMRTTECLHAKTSHYNLLYKRHICRWFVLMFSYSRVQTNLTKGKICRVLVKEKIGITMVFNHLDKPIFILQSLKKKSNLGWGTTVLSVDFYNTLNYIPCRLLKGVQSMTLNWICCYGSGSKALGRVWYLFIIYPNISSGR